MLLFPPPAPDNIGKFPDDSASTAQVTTTTATTHLVDLGCGDGTAAVEMVQAFSEVLLSRATGTCRSGSSTRSTGTKQNSITPTTTTTIPITSKLIYHGFDNDDRFLRKTFEALNTCKHTCGKDLSNVEIDIRNVDITGGDRLPLLLPIPIDYTFMSVGHVLYYARNAVGITNVVDNLIQILGKGSMAMFVHTAQAPKIAIWQC